MTHSTATAIPSQEWDTLGDTLRHVAHLSNPSAGPQRGYVDGHRDAEYIHESAGADGWQELQELLRGLKREIAQEDHTSDYVAAYNASVDAILVLVQASIPAHIAAFSKREGMITISDLHVLERGMNAASADEEQAMRIATGVVANAMHEATAPDDEMAIETRHAENILADHRAYLTSNSILRAVMTSEQIAAYDEMARKIISI